MSVQLKTNALLAGMATGGLIAAGLIGLGTPTASAAPGCSDVEVVFARGTDEPVGVGREGQAFVDALKSDLKGRKVSAYARVAMSKRPLRRVQTPRSCWADTHRERPSSTSSPPQADP
jgi:hypothetical protein